MLRLHVITHDLWRVIKGDKENHKKDHLTLSMILISILKFHSHQINMKKSAKENREILCTFCESGLCGVVKGASVEERI